LSRFKLDSPIASSLKKEDLMSVSKVNLQRAPHGAIVLVAVVLVCLNLRVVFGGVGPLIPYMHLSTTNASALTGFPPLCMGIFAPLGSFFSHRLGHTRALFWAMLILIAGILVRSSGNAGLLIGTVIASSGIAALNVLTPVFIRQQFAPERVGLMTGVYAMMMGGGGGVMAALAIPLYYASGNSWAFALGTAALPALIALAALMPLFGASRPDQVQTHRRNWSNILHDITVWSLIAFFGVQTLVFYAVLAWLPAICISKGADAADAGFNLALCIFAVAAGGFLGPMIAAKRDNQRAHILVSIGLCIVGLAGVLLSPASYAPVWVVLLGIGLGAGQGIPSILFAKRSRSSAQMAELSSVVQTVGYLIAATGPILVAALHDWSGGWVSPVAALLALLAINACVSLPGGADMSLSINTDPLLANTTEIVRSGK
jgi:CP family cyanate transporter-like MFS transporter